MIVGPLLFSLSQADCDSKNNTSEALELERKLYHIAHLDKRLIRQQLLVYYRLLEVMACPYLPLVVGPFFFTGGHRKVDPLHCGFLSIQLNSSLST